MNPHDWIRTWVWSARTQDAGRIWFTHVWQTYIPITFGEYMPNSGVYIYRKEKPIT